MFVSAWRSALEKWVDRSGKILLIGEAAHPLLLMILQPCSTHGASMAVEDGEALGVLVAHLRMRAQIPQIMEGFQELHQVCCNFIYRAELSNASLTMLPAGEVRGIYDAGLHASLETGVEKWDKGVLRDQWEQIGEGFAYHAREASEDWWMKWGALGEASAGLAANFAIQVTMG
ncbi:hypothetical protein B0H17DRAFT_1137680 [Mycena rosella]|uniref:Uncharacterized protein n=1 Tax=Mycena rosella TaxID=1033263 RepID=A0AAD7D8L2_MYCRO|nr:hypothetical protein B0H17DRAFT_1137680 [Mycena rosella]